MPALLGLTGELIQVGGTSYFKTSLTGDKFQSQKTADSLPVNPGDSKSLVDSIGEALLAAGRGPGQGRRRRLRQHAVLHGQDRADARRDQALGGGGAVASELPIDLGAASLNLTIRVEKDSNRLAGLAAAASMGDQGSLTLDLTFSKWDQAVSISAPPADQVQAGLVTADRPTAGRRRAAQPTMGG